MRSAITGFLLIFLTFSSYIKANTEYQPINPQIPGMNIEYRPVMSMKARKYENLIRQRTDFSCGAASLATILRYAYEINVDEKTVLEGLFAVSDPETVMRLGFSLLDIKNYVQALGFRGRGYEVSEQTLSKIKIPTIVLLDINGYKHFVVLQKVTETEMYVGDPALGNQIIPRKTFLEQWNGIVFAVIGAGLKRDTVLLNPRQAITARKLHDVTAPLTAAELLDYGFTHAELF